MFFISKTISYEIKHDCLAQLDCLTGELPARRNSMRLPACRDAPSSCMGISGSQCSSAWFNLPGGLDRSAIQNTQFHPAIGDPALGGCVVSNGLRLTITPCRQVGGVRAVGDQVVQNRVGTIF